MHNLHDLTKMQLEFQTFDVESSIRQVQWRLHRHTNTFLPHCKIGQTTGCGQEHEADGPYAPQSVQFHSQWRPNRYSVWLPARTPPLWGAPYVWCEPDGIKKNTHLENNTAFLSRAGTSTT